MIDDVLHASRVANVALSLLALLFLTMRFNDAWHRLPGGWKVVCAGILGLCLAGAFASVEGLIQGAQNGYRSPLLTGVDVLLLLGLWLSRNHHLSLTVLAREGTPQEGSTR